MYKVNILHKVLLCDKNNIQVFHPGGVEPLHLDGGKNTEMKIYNIIHYIS